MLSSITVLPLSFSLFISTTIVLPSYFTTTLITSSALHPLDVLFLLPPTPTQHTPSSITPRSASISLELPCRSSFASTVFEKHRSVATLTHTRIRVSLPNQHSHCHCLPHLAYQQHLILPGTRVWSISFKAQGEVRSCRTPRFSNFERLEVALLANNPIDTVTMVDLL